jgi:aryl-alcohol dehydrogenase-like predicted oxidoreductase
MELRTIGSLEVSAVGLGCNNFGSRLDAAATAAVVGEALDNGVTLFDTADVYGTGLSEEYLGAALRGRRDAAVIATKFGAVMPDGEGASPKWIDQAVAGSLRRLRTDHIDLYQLHLPDEETPVEDTLEALDRLVAAGTVREIGCSNASARWIGETVGLSTNRRLAGWASVQNHYSLLHRDPEDDGVLEACRRHGIAFIPYFPLASGMLTGKYRSGAPAPEGTRLASIPADRATRFMNEEAFAVVDRLEGFAQARGRSVLSLAFAYLLGRPEVASVISGATSAEQVAANVAAAEWRLDTAASAEVAALTAL